LSLALLALKSVKQVATHVGSVIFAGIRPFSWKDFAYNWGISHESSAHAYLR